MHAELKRYQKAAIELLRSGKDVKMVLDGVRSSMARRGHLKLYPSLLRALVRSYPRIAKKQMTTLVVAKEADATRYGEKKGEINLQVDPTIIGGYVRIKDDTREDNSYKRKLLTWYRRATSTD